MLFYQVIYLSEFVIQTQSQAEILTYQDRKR